jgi:WD40 repeat protein
LVALGSVSAQQKGENDNDPPLKMGLLRDVGVSADGKLAIAGDSEGNIWVWDIRKRDLIRVIRGNSENENAIYHFAFSADGKRAIVGIQKGIQLGGEPRTKLWRETLTFWDLSAGVRLRAFDLEDEQIYAVALSRDGKHAISVGLWKTIIPEGLNPLTVTPFNVKFVMAVRLWDTASGKLLRTLQAEELHFPVCISPSGKSIVSPLAHRRDLMGGKQKWELRRWDLQGAFLGTKSMSAEFTAMNVTCCEISPEGKHIAIGHPAGFLSLWNIETGKLAWYYQTDVVRQSIVIERRWVGSVAFSPDKKRIVAAGGGVFMIELATGKSAPKFVGTADGVASVNFTPDGAMVLGARPNGVQFWDSDTGHAVFTLKR